MMSFQWIIVCSVFAQLFNLIDITNIKVTGNVYALYPKFPVNVAD